MEENSSVVQGQEEQLIQEVVQPKDYSSEIKDVKTLLQVGLVAEGFIFASIVVLIIYKGLFKNV